MGAHLPEEYQVLLDEDFSWGYSCLTMIDEETVGILYESSVSAHDVSSGETHGYHTDPQEITDVVGNITILFQHGASDCIL